MKDRIIIGLLIFSLALNFVILGFFIHHRLVPQGIPKQDFPLRRYLERTENGRDLIHNVLPKHRRKIMELKRDLFQHRQEFFNQLQAEDINYKEIEHLVDDIIRVQSALEREIANSMTSISQKLNYPERKELLKRIMNKRAVPYRSPRKNHIKNQERD
ncbi:MAG: hypothetical protein DRH57_07155 [Candidatus Cloacimonadota bacterium]|nr:MAG: hypothetical protein DRH57_07155 [Candidatus Cloacimonadota bacterium]